MWSIKRRKSFINDLKRFKGEKIILNKLKEILQKLKENPFCCNAKKLTGYERLFRIRMGNYRLIYEIDFENKSIILILFNHRKKVYKKLENKD